MECPLKSSSPSDLPLFLPRGWAGLFIGAGRDGRWVVEPSRGSLSASGLAFSVSCGSAGLPIGALRFAEPVLSAAGTFGFSEDGEEDMSNELHAAKRGRSLVDRFPGQRDASNIKGGMHKGERKEDESLTRR